MNVDPVYASIGQCFGNKLMYMIPKYQRSYAWDKSEIEDFLNDIETAFNKRKVGNPINHFFGGIVSVGDKVTGTVNQREHELVDGQQRMATFVIFAACIIAVYHELLVEATTAADQPNIKIIERRINELTTRFIEFEQEVNRKTSIVEVLTLSKADEYFFRDMVRYKHLTESRDSHAKLQFAYKEILGKVKELSLGNTLDNKLDLLEIFNQIIDIDLSIIHIMTDNKTEAYTLFRVLNDRGKSLTDGDLLRARTLELLEGFAGQQSSVEKLWDEILSDQPNVTEEYLRWIYASFHGARPGNNSLYDDFLKAFFPQNSNATILAIDANNILATTQSLLKEIQNCRNLVIGEWPFPTRNQISPWDINRLSLLLRELGLKVTMPVLLAACHIDQVKFAETVQILERFLFRFKIIGSMHITPVQALINTESVVIRQNPQTYTVSSLQVKLHAIQIAKVNDSLFKNLLSNLNYKDGGTNQPIKYFLMTLEHYYRWYLQGATGEPKCLDKTRIYDFSSTTIEHIYPKNAHGAVIDVALEPLKNSIGNLTFMGQGDNNTGANNDFNTKKPIFLSSSVLMNQQIGGYSSWDGPTLHLRETNLKDMACKVFNV